MPVTLQKAQSLIVALVALAFGTGIGASGVTLFSADSGPVINGDNNTVHAQSGPGPFAGSAADLCNAPGTQITLRDGEEYSAIAQVDGTRFDLTWRPGGTVVAVEELQGRELRPWAAQADSAFWGCVNRAPVVSAGGH